MTWTLILSFLDPVLIAPYRLLSPYPDLAFWFGTLVLALVCIVLGEASMALVYLVNRGYYARLNREMIRMHNISVDAIRQKNKSVYKSANSWANEYFGKVFFAQAALFAVSLWPLPFALGWMQQRFAGIAIATVPGIDWELEYPFALIGGYIVLRFLFSRIKHRLPLFDRIEAMHKEDAQLSGELASWNE
ncbi:hypothetical protein [Desulfoplanes formicivorans]|uniref:DUF106 domain-containing protein n=1 Tax=Desulfoplanes formicivorans TaxID=1592317 RepID=A0A194AK22_9BACT|nr:hypothetical protein [Desulfoplanes formicivorans]GAU09406.1 hypothetical protein DPF_2132 [Desulfoplanes formicivorans]